METGIKKSGYSPDFLIPVYLNYRQKKTSINVLEIYRRIKTQRGRDFP